MRKIALCLAISALSACVAGDRGLRDLESASNGPDEFTVSPVAPLELPEDLNALPEPTPGAGNRVDPDPQGDVIEALGGAPSARSAGGIPSRDAALVATTGRFGVEDGIRADLAAEDEAFRNRRGRISILGIGRRDRYNSAYASQTLDAGSELERLRAQGVPTPSAPPAN